MVTFGTLEKPEPIVTRPYPSLQIDEHGIGWLAPDDPELATERRTFYEAFSG